MDAIPFRSSLRPKYGTVLLAIKHTHAVPALFGSGSTMDEGMCVVMGHAHLPTLRDMPVSAQNYLLCVL